LKLSKVCSPGNFLGLHFFFALVCALALVGFTMTALTPLLDQAEAHIQQAADALLASDTAQLEHSSSLLREAAALLSRALSGPAARAALSAQELARVRSVNERLGVVREQLARVLALADRQLASVVPQEPAPTYGAGHRPTARIYRAAG